MSATPNAPTESIPESTSVPDRETNIDFVLEDFYKRQEANEIRKEELFRRVLSSLGHVEGSSDVPVPYEIILARQQLAAKRVDEVRYVLFTHFAPHTSHHILHTTYLLLTF